MARLSVTADTTPDFHLWSTTPDIYQSDREENRSGQASQLARVNLMRPLLRNGIITSMQALVITSMQVLSITSMQVLSIHVHRSAGLARISLLELSLKSIIGNNAVSPNVF